MIEVNRWNKNGLSLSYYITSACNNRCEYCYMLGELDNSKKFNHEVFDQFKNAFNMLDRTYKIDLTLLGGEPLFVDGIQRIKELDFTNVELTIFSNLNYSESNFKERLELIEGLDYLICCSFHESSNLGNVKKNVLYLQENGKNVEASFLINTENINRMKEHVEFVIRHDIPYTINPLKDNGSDEYVNFFDENFGDNLTMMKTWLSGSSENGEVTFDDRPLTSEEVCEFRIPELSYIYYLQCNPNPFKISYDGVIVVSCEYEYKSHISKGLDVPKMVFCSNKTCVCDVIAYKRLLRPKDKDENEKFHKHFGC